MKNSGKKRVFAITTISVLLLGAAPLQENAATTQCCFTNRAYNGVCQVTPAKGETCASILKYLNTAGTVGKTYCGNTRIRGGWRSVSCR